MSMQMNEEMEDAEYENDVLISGSCGLCIMCDEWVQMNKFVGPDTADFEKNGPSQPCYQCRLYCSMNIEEEEDEEEEDEEEEDEEIELDTKYCTECSKWIVEPKDIKLYQPCRLCKHEICSNYCRECV